MCVSPGNAHRRRSRVPALWPSTDDTRVPFLHGEVRFEIENLFAHQNVSQHEIGVDKYASTQISESLQKQTPYRPYPHSSRGVGPTNCLDWMHSAPLDRQFPGRDGRPECDRVLARHGIPPLIAVACNLADNCDGLNPVEATEFSVKSIGRRIATRSIASYQTVTGDMRLFYQRPH